MTAKPEKAETALWLTIFLCAAAATAAAAYYLYDSLFPILLGFGLAYAFDPLADWIEKQGLGRTASVAIIMTAVFGSAALALALIVPWLASEATEFAGHLPGYVSVALDRASLWLTQWDIQLPHDREFLLERLRSWAKGVSVSALSPLGRFAGRFFTSAAGSLVGTLNLIAVPVVFFYFLRDISAIRRAALEFFPPRLRRAADRRLEEADLVFSGYLRGQMSVALLLAILYSAGLTLAGIRFGIVIGILSGLLNIVPYLGVLSGLILSLIMAAVEFAGLWAFAKVLIVFGVCQFLEGFIITPRVVGDRVGLSPVETIIALILGGELAGLLGLVLAIPMAGCLKAYARDAFQAWRASPLYR